MKIFIQHLLTYFTILLSCFGIYSQCNLNPIVDGIGVICPYDSVVTLSTQQYESYQWYYREYLDTMANPIQGATNQTIQINIPEQVGYFSVEVTKDTCVEISDEYEASVIGFIPPEISWSQEVFIENSNLYLCEEESATLGYTYTHNIIWFRNGDTIQLNDPILEITEGGKYTAQGSPVECPELIFTHPEVEILDTTCVTSTSEYNEIKVLLYPNPSKDFLWLKYDNYKLQIDYVEIYDIEGKLHSIKEISNATGDVIDISALHEGVYLLVLSINNDLKYLKKFIKQ